MTKNRKITQILSLVFLILFSASCKKQCYSTDEFNVSNASVDSYPTTDGIDGSAYDPINGGQTARWHDTGFKSNGDAFLIRISGAWTPWSGGIYHEMSEAELAALPLCSTCAKKDISTPNCICYSNQQVTSEFLKTCNPSTDQDNPNLCSCTKNPAYGTALDYGVYHFPLNYYDKNETVKIADRQSTCKFTGGMGAYIGLFGRSGVTDPKRVYHLFTDNYDKNGNSLRVCDITLNSNGECKDNSGIDRTAYIFKSDNNRIFMKDDLEGNNGTNNNTANDTYHGPNEVVKLKIYDVYYNDNFGKYNVDILKGVGDNSDLSTVGLLEFMVRLVENTLLGDIQPTTTLSQDASGQTVTTTTYARSGGIIEFMYKSIVQDSGFMLFLQVSLSLYIAFYGFAVLLGVAAISKKELIGRCLKISLVMFFTGASSWVFYNRIIVAFFYDSMNYMVSMMMSLSDASLSQGMDTSAIVVAQMDRAVDISSSTRFSYIDSTIEMMLSQAFAAKAFSLVLSDIFGLIYAIAIYALVAYFIYVMLIAAQMYLVNMMKIIFVLCLGPIFISFVLFKDTSAMFKNWLGFLGARSLEVILIFAILYNFVMMINAAFSDLMSYKACVEAVNFGELFTINLLKASGIGDRTIITWSAGLIKIGALIFITSLMLEKIADLANSLITIDGVSGGANFSTANAGSSKNGPMGVGIMASLKSAGSQIASNAFSVGTEAAVIGGRAISDAASRSGISDRLSAVGDYSPLKMPRQMMRNAMIDPIINQAKKEAAEKKLTGKAADQFIRSQTFAKLQNQAAAPSLANPNLSTNRPILSALAGSNNANHIAARLDQKLIHEPARDFLKQRAKELKANSASNLLLGKDMEKQLLSDLRSWGEKNLHGGNEDFQNILNNLSNGNTKSLSSTERNLLNTIQSEGNLSYKQAANLLAGKPEQQQKYLQHLQDNEFKRSQNNQAAFENRFKNIEGFGNWAKNLANRGFDGVARITGSKDEIHNPNVAQQSFMRNLRNQERTGGMLNLANYNPLNRSNTLDHMAGRLGFGAANSLDKRVSSAQENNLRNQLAQNQNFQDKDSNKRHEFNQGKLQDLANKDLFKSVSDIRKLERKGQFNEANAAKKDLLGQTQNALIMDRNNPAFTSDGRTLFEKASRLSYLHEQFGIKGKDPMLQLSKALNQAIKDGSANITQQLSNGANTENLHQDAENLKALRAGLFTDLKGDKEFDAMAKALNPTVQDLISANNDKINDTRITTLEQDREQRDLNNKEVNKDAASIQTQLDELDKKMQEAQTKADKTEEATAPTPTPTKGEIETPEETAKKLTEMAERAEDLSQSNDSIADDLKQKSAEHQKFSEQYLSDLEAIKNDYDLIKTQADSAEKDEAMKALHNRLDASSVMNDEINQSLAQIRNLSEQLESQRNELVELNSRLHASEALNQDVAKLREEAQNNPPQVRKDTSEVTPTPPTPPTPSTPETETESKATPTKSGGDSPVKGLPLLGGEGAGNALLGGEGLSNALLSGQGLVVDNPGFFAAMLGAIDNANKAISDSKVKELGMQKTAINGQLKMHNLNLKLKEFELSRLEATGANPADIAALESEIKDLKKEITSLEKEELSIENTINSDK